MAILETTLLFEVTPAPLEDGTHATLLFDVRPSTVTPPHLLFDVTQVVGAFDQLKPLGTVRQHVTPKITYSIRGTNHEIHLADLASTEDVVLELTKDGSSWAWSFEDQALASTRDEWVPPVIGWPVEWGTVAPGKNPVAFDIAYLTEALETMAYQIMAEGITRSNSSDSFHLACKGVGAEGRWDAAVVSLFLEPGHGKTHGEIIRLLLEGAKDPDTGATVISPSAILFDEEIGSTLNNPIDLDCVNAWAEARRVGDQAGVAIVAGVAGDLTATVVALPKADIDSASRFSLSEGDFLAADFRIDEINADHPTCIVVTSNAVDTAGADGSVTTKVIELVFDNFAVDGAFFSQDNDSLDPVFGIAGPLGDPFLQLKTRRTTATTTRDGCPERVEITFEGYFNPIAARYRVASGAPSPDLSIARNSTIIVYIKDPDAVDFDTATAYRFRYDQWSVINYSVTHLAGPSAAAPRSGRLPQWVMDAVFPGQSEDFTFLPPGGTAEQTTEDLPFAIRGVEVGRQRHELTFEGGWLNPERALKDRALQSTDWESVTYDSGFLDASLNGVVDEGEFFYADVSTSHPVSNLAHGLVVPPNVGGGFLNQDRWLKVALVAREFTLEGVADPSIEGGYLTRDFVADRQWGRLDGSLFLYAGGAESDAAEDAPLWRPVATEKRYSAESNSGPHTETETQFEFGGDISPDFPRVKKGLAGYLPAMPVCFETLRDELVPLRVRVCLAPDEDVFVGKEQEIAVDYIETDEGLEEYATRLLRELTPLIVRGSIPVDARLRPWLPGTFDFPRRGYNSRRCWVGNVKIPSTQTPRGIMTTMQIMLKVPIL